MDAAGVVMGILALVGSFTSDRRTRAEQRSLQNLLAVSQLRACSILGVPPLPMVAQQVSTLATDGRTIFYSEPFVRGAIQAVCSKPECAEGLVLAMVAHELAHAYCHPQAEPGHRIELEADCVAGYVLGRVGMTTDDFVTVLGTFRSTLLHPPTRARTEAVRHGFARGTAERLAGAR